MKTLRDYINLIEAVLQEAPAKNVSINSVPYTMYQHRDGFWYLPGEAIPRNAEGVSAFNDPKINQAQDALKGIAPFPRGYTGKDPQDFEKGIIAPNTKKVDPSIGGIGITTEPPPKQIAPGGIGQSRPGLAPGGDPRVWDWQNEMKKKGAPITTDGLYGDQTDAFSKKYGIPAPDGVKKLPPVSKPAPQSLPTPTAPSPDAPGTTTDNGITTQVTPMEPGSQAEKDFYAKRGLTPPTEPGGIPGRIDNRYDASDAEYNKNYNPDGTPKVQVPAPRNVAPAPKKVAPNPEMKQIAPGIGQKEKFSMPMSPEEFQKEKNMQGQMYQKTPINTVRESADDKLLNQMLTIAGLK